MIRSIFAIAALAFSATAMAGKPIIIIDRTAKKEPTIIEQIKRIVTNPIIIIEGTK